MSDPTGGHRAEEAREPAHEAERGGTVGAGSQIVWHGSDRSDGLLTLPGGRSVGVAQFGRPQGAPVIWCHGGLSSRIDAALADAAAARTGLRLIALDRPGIGRSSLRRNDDLLRWPAIVAECADQLGLEGFGVVGWSAGGPYALACAYMLPARVRAVATIAGMTAVTDRTRRRELGLGLDRRLIGLSLATPRVAGIALEVIRMAPDRLIWRAMRHVGGPPSVRPSSRTPARSWSECSARRCARGQRVSSRTIARSDPIGGSRRRSSPHR